MDIILETWSAFCLLAVMPFTAGWMELLIKFIPFVLFLSNVRLRTCMEDFRRFYSLSLQYL